MPDVMYFLIYISCYCARPQASLVNHLLLHGAQFYVQLCERQGRARTNVNVCSVAWMQACQDAHSQVVAYSSLSDFFANSFLAFLLVRGTKSTFATRNNKHLCRTHKSSCRTRQCLVGVML